jgi:hypothetical protein
MEKIYFNVTNEGHIINFRNYRYKFTSKLLAISFLKENNINNFVGISGNNRYKFILSDKKGFECFGFVLKKYNICNS